MHRCAMLMLLTALTLFLLSCHKDDERTVSYIDEAFSAGVQMDDGGFILAGTRRWVGHVGNVTPLDSPSPQAEGKDLYLVRTDAAGNSLWERTFQMGYCGGNMAMVRDAGGTVTIAGMASIEYSGVSLFVLKVGSSGNLLWHQLLSDSMRQDVCVIPTRDGGFAFAGVDYFPNPRFVHCDAAGNIVTQRGYHPVPQPGPGHPYWGGITQIAEGIDGRFLLSDGYYLLNVSAEGDSMWLNAPAFPIDGTIDATVPSDDGGFLVFWTNFPASGGATEFQCRKITTEGDTVWTHQSTLVGSDYVRSTIPVQNGGFGLCGYSVSGNRFSPPMDLYLLRCSSEGEAVWDRNFGMTNFELAWSLLECRDGGFLVLGWTNLHHTQDGGGDAIAVRTDASGNVLWQHTFGQ